MKRIILLMVVAVSFLQVGVCFAQASKTVAFKVSATVPKATSINVVATKIVGTTWATAPSTELNFDPLNLDAQFGTFLSPHYFAIDVGTGGGAGSPQVNVKYTEGLNPNNDVTKGLGAKTIATFVKVTGATGSQTEASISGHPAQKRLIDLVAGETFTSAQISGGFFRSYVGVWTGQKTPDTPTTAQVFSLGDVPGVYDGTLTFSVTVS